ncbi:putative structural protein [Bordetella phage LK3]|uniref:Putative structural protein n=1 Tax=Bordetella phage LK3 TaxID=1926943 RepID=A0A2D0W900_9CAUD|nr:putative structural protein [Bordetella phage LK3]
MDYGDDMMIDLEGIGPVAVLPFQPEAPMKETLAWKTDLITSWDGSEFRQEIRHAPRQSFELACPVQPEFQPLAQHLIYGARNADHWGVPVWAELQRVGAVSFGATTIAADTTSRDFRVGGWVLLWEDPENWRVRQILSLTPTQIEITEQVGLTMRYAWVAPLRIARLGATPERSLNGYRSDLGMAFDVVDNVRLPDPSGIVTYEGFDLVTWDNLMSGMATNEKTNSHIELLDYDAGLVGQFHRWLRPKSVRPLRVILRGAAELWAFRRWLHRRAGRLRPFWIPSGEPDLWLDMIGPITTHVMFRDDGFMAMAARPEHIAIQAADGTWYARKLVEPTLTGSIVTAELNAPLPSVDSGGVLRVSFLGLKRLDTDRVDLEHRGGAVCTCEMNILELRT